MNGCLYICRNHISSTNQSYMHAFLFVDYQNLILKHSKPVFIPVPPPFPNSSPTVTLHHSQLFLWVKRSQEESYWFFCIIASHSETIFHWVAANETTRAFLFVVLWLLLPRWKNIRKTALCSLCWWVRCCQLYVAYSEVWRLVLG